MNAMSIGGLAEHLGVPRQRIYHMVKRGLIKTQWVGGSQVVSALEVAKVIEASRRVETAKGSRIVFDFI